MYDVWNFYKSELVLTDNDKYKVCLQKDNFKRDCFERF